MSAIAVASVGSKLCKVRTCVHKLKQMGMHASMPSPRRRDELVNIMMPCSEFKLAKFVLHPLLISNQRKFSNKKA